MASYIWLRTILIVRKETRCRHIGYSYRLTARVLLYAPCHRHDNTYHSLCYTSRGALAGTRNSSMGPPHEGSIRRPTAPWANALPLSYVPLRKPGNWEGEKDRSHRSEAAFIYKNKQKTNKTKQNKKTKPNNSTELLLLLFIFYYYYYFYFFIIDYRCLVVGYKIKTMRLTPLHYRASPNFTLKSFKI